MIDSRFATYEHIQIVQQLLGVLIRNLMYRQEMHDQSKLYTPEKEIYDLYTPKLAESTYGSDEYKQFLKEMKLALDHHYINNSHHPEHYRWHCPICNLQINDATYNTSPEGPDNSKNRYCPNCSGIGILYESELMLKPQLGIQGMSLIDLLEMLIDWKAATLRHNDGNILKSIEINQKRFGYDTQLKQIFLNTLKELKLL